jgi:hypothetical protein
MGVSSGDQHEEIGVFFLGKNMDDSAIATM